MQAMTVEKAPRSVPDTEQLCITEAGSTFTRASQPTIPRLFPADSRLGQRPLGTPQNLKTGATELLELRWGARASLLISLARYYKLH